MTCLECWQKKAGLLWIWVMGAKQSKNPYNPFMDPPKDRVHPIKHVKLIVNPYSGGKKGQRILDLVLPVFDTHNVKVTVLKTTHAGHATEYAMEEKMVDALCCIGGDGTVHEVINGMMRRSDETRVPIGIIPGGSGNTFAYDFGIQDVINAATRIATGTTMRTIDILAVDPLVNDTAQVEKRLFGINIVGWGLPSTVLPLANKLRVMGRAQYNLAAALKIFKKQVHHAKVQSPKIHFLDSSPSDEADWNTIQSSFSPYFMIQAQLNVHMGSKAPFCPSAKLDDGLMDLVLVEKSGTMQIIRNFDDGKKNGKHIHHPNVKYVQVAQMDIIPSDTTALHGEKTVNIDGELVGTSPCRVTCLPRVLDILI